MSDFRQVPTLAQMPLSGFDDAQAARLVENSEAFQLWLHRHGVMVSSPEARAVMAQAANSYATDETEQAVPRVAAPLASAHPLRSDTAELRAFAAAYPWLSERMRQVFELCIQRGLTLNACAAQLGIARETVRVHLRRLRLLRRRFGA